MKPQLIDITLNGRFVCQVKYTKRGFPEEIDGQIVEVHRMDDICSFIESLRPSLKGKDYHIEFTNQKV